MTLNILLSAPQSTIQRFSGAIKTALRDAGLDVDLRTDHPPGKVDYIVYAPNEELTDFSPFSRARAVLSLWAGVEKIVTNPTLNIPLARMVDAGLREGMVEYVTGHVLRHHLGMDAHILNPDHLWRNESPPLARSRAVGILGLGELGRACADALCALNFSVSGWSRTPKSIQGINCLSGRQGLDRILATSDILVLLLPLTPSTEKLLDAQRLAQLPQGAVVINPGRGALIDDDALLEAVDSGRIGHATLDVFREEPLPPDHPFWAHPRITVTPHVASDTRPETASLVIAENIRRSEAGLPLRHLVDRRAGY